MPKIYLKDAIFHGKTFCCCLPVRFGVICMSFLGILFGGLLSVLLWFELSDTSKMKTSERTAFILAGLVETLLFIASVLGFIGVIVRKQLFTQIYAYFIYVHFVVNVVVAGYFLYIVSHISNTAISKACDDTIKDAQAQSQCSGLFNDFRTVLIVVAVVVLLTELYGALIVARYVHQIKTEKQTARSSRMILLDSAGRSGRMSMMPGSAQYHQLSGSGEETPLSSAVKTPNRDFDPYMDMEHPPPRFPSYSPGPSSSYAYDGVPETEEGYGGGSWTHHQISQDEKSNLHRQDEESESVTVAPLSEEAQSHRDAKTPAGPPPMHAEVDELPRYSPSSPGSLHHRQ